MRPELSNDPWSNYCRALTEQDREAFNELTNKVATTPEATITANFTNPVEGKLLSILLENEKELRRLRTL